jgi:hypothetical protein
MRRDKPNQPPTHMLPTRYLLVGLLTLVAVPLLSQNPSPSALISGKPQQQQSAPTQRPTDVENRGTQESPILVKQLPPENAQAQTEQEALDHTDKTTNDGKLVYFTKWLVIATLILGAVGFFQLFVFGEQARQLRKTVQAAADQSVDMKESIAQAARTAKAMEDVATHFNRSVIQAETSTATFSKRGEQQTRAYICVEVGTAVAQAQATNSKFGALTIMLNAGNTPAYKVGFRASVAVLPLPLAADFAFPLPDVISGYSILGPHQKMNITRFVDEFVPEEQVPDIKIAKGKALCIWGIIEYVDVFSAKRTTKFCQILNWGADGKTVFGTYHSQHNDAD